MRERHVKDFDDCVSSNHLFEFSIPTRETFIFFLLFFNLFFRIRNLKAIGLQLSEGSGW